MSEVFRSTSDTERRIHSPDATQPYPFGHGAEAEIPQDVEIDVVAALPPGGPADSSARGEALETF
jgi:hypothetical protein